MENIERLNKRFWNDELNSYEVKVLKKAGFQAPVDFFDVPYIGLISLKGMNRETALDVLFAMAKYCGLFGKKGYDIAGKIDNYILDLGYDSAFMPDSERALLNVDEMLYAAGYDEEETAKMTVRQMLKLKGLSMKTLSALAETVERAYFNRFILPKGSFETRAELFKGRKLLFRMRRSEA